MNNKPGDCRQSETVKYYDWIITGRISFTSWIAYQGQANGSGPLIPNASPKMFVNDYKVLWHLKSASTVRLLTLP